MTPVQADLILALSRCIPMGNSWERRFVEHFLDRARARQGDSHLPQDVDPVSLITLDLTTAQAAALDRQAHVYRRQLGQCRSAACPDCHPVINTRASIEAEVAYLQARQVAIDEILGSQDLKGEPASPEMIKQAQDSAFDPGCSFDLENLVPVKKMRPGPPLAVGQRWCSGSYSDLDPSTGKSKWQWDKEIEIESFTTDIPTKVVVRYVRSGVHRRLGEWEFSYGGRFRYQPPKRS